MGEKNAPLLEFLVDGHQLGVVTRLDGVPGLRVVLGPYD